jgi:hypothetical protein
VCTKKNVLLNSGEQAEREWTALQAKMLCNTPEEYEIFEEFVFHNYEDVMPTHDEVEPIDHGEEKQAKPNKRKQKEETKKAQKQKQLSIREKFTKFHRDVFQGVLLDKYPDFHGPQQANQMFKILFHVPDFSSLRHPKFWNNEASILSKKQRSRNRSRKNSVSNIASSYHSAATSENASVSGASSKKKSKAYISKKKIKQMLEEETELKRKQEEEILRQEREEEEWR